MPTQDPPNYLFLGEEDFLKEEAIGKLKAKFLDSQTNALNFSVFYAKEKDFDVQGMMDALNTLPFVSKKRIVVLRGGDSLLAQAKESVLSYLKNPKDTTIFIIETKTSVIREGFIYEVSQLAKLVYNRKLTDLDIARWLAGKASSSGKRISQEAINLIKENLPNDLKIFSSYMDNLVLYTGKRPDITRQDVEKLIDVNPLSTSFELLDAIERRDVRKALTILNSLRRQKKKEVELLGLLGWQFRMILRVKELLKLNKDRVEICKELGIYSTKFDQIVRYADRFKRNAIKAMLNEILSADRDIKTSALSTMFVMERLIVRMCL